MKKYTIILVACGALALAGCQTAGQVADQITSTTQTVTAKAKEVQSYAKSVCGYLPAISSVIAIFNSGYSASVQVVGDAVCGAVTNLPLADGPGKREPRVNGILIKGKFVR